MQFNSATIATFVIALASIGGVAALKGSGSVATIAYATCLALFASSVFYAATVLFPEGKKELGSKKNSTNNIIRLRSGA